jgi:hypothetical protein
MKLGLGNPLGEVARLLVECDPKHPVEKFPAGTLTSLHPRSGQELLLRGIVESTAKRDAQETPVGRGAGQSVAPATEPKRGQGAPPNYCAL